MNYQTHSVSIESRNMEISSFKKPPMKKKSHAESMLSITSIEDIKQKLKMNKSNNKKSNPTPKCFLVH